MTTKELLYVKDSLDHEKFYQTKCCEIAAKLTDGELKSYVEDLEKKHGEIYKNIYGLL